MKFCKDCKWSVGTDEYATCAQPLVRGFVDEAIPVSMVTGEKESEVVGFCDNARRYGPCGKAAKLWVPKTGETRKRKWWEWTP